MDHDFIRRYAVTPVNVRDSQLPPSLLDPENEHDGAWADSAYSGQWLENLPYHAGFESLIHEKGTHNHPLSVVAKSLNRVKSSIRACVEHVFRLMITSTGGKLTRKIGVEKSEAWWGLKNLAFNFLRYLQRSRNIAART